MSRELSTIQCEAIERMIDGASLAALLDAVAIICRDKAEHIRSNWQDDGLAACWGSQADELYAVSARCEV